jgi:hypothetical protein
VKVNLLRGVADHQLLQLDDDIDLSLDNLNHAAHLLDTPLLDEASQLLHVVDVSSGDRSHQLTKDIRLVVAEHPLDELFGLGVGYISESRKDCSNNLGRRPAHVGRHAFQPLPNLRLVQQRVRPTSSFRLIDTQKNLTQKILRPYLELADYR